MRLLVWIGTGFRTFRARVVLCIPLLYLLTDIAGGLTAFFGEAAGVARVAHLAGFAVGGLAALAMAKLPRPFLVESEIESFRKLRRTRDLKTLIDDARELLAKNPDNHKVMEWTAWRIVRWTQAVDVSE